SVMTKVRDPRALDALLPGLEGLLPWLPPGDADRAYSEMEPLARGDHTDDKSAKGYGLAALALLSARRGQERMAADQGKLEERLGRALESADYLAQVRVLAKAAADLSLGLHPEWAESLCVHAGDRFTLLAGTATDETSAYHLRNGLGAVA